MSQIQSATLALAGVTIGFLLLAFVLLRARRKSATPDAARRVDTPDFLRESRFPSLSRRNRAAEEPIEIAPSRLARISGKAPIDTPVEAAPEAGTVLRVTQAPAPEAPESAPPREADQAKIGQMLESIVAKIEQEAEQAGRSGGDAVTVRLVPQIPPRDIANPTSWLGGRPRLDRGAPWPEIREIPAVFLAQIRFADLPRDLWDGLGPREGAFALFTHPHDGDPRIVPVAAPGETIDPPRAQDDADHWFTPRGGLPFGDLRPFGGSGLPAWPVDLVAVGLGDPDPHDSETGSEEGPTDRFHRAGYDIADPAFHPFDWDLMAALAEILAMRIERFWRDIDGPSPVEVQIANVDRRLTALDAGGDDATDRATLENMRISLGELVDATAAAAAMNRDARARAEEIVAIVRDSAHKAAFSASDAAAVMGALQAIRWTRVHRSPDPEGRPGAERIESQILPLTRHHPDAPLWVHDYHSVWFDHARHAYASDPDALSAEALMVLEPWCRELAQREMASMGGAPVHHVRIHDPETHVTLLELLPSTLIGWEFGGDGPFCLALRKADLAIGRFDRPAVQAGH